MLRDKNVRKAIALNKNNKHLILLHAWRNNRAVNKKKNIIKMNILEEKCILYFIKFIEKQLIAHD